MENFFTGDLLTTIGKSGILALIVIFFLFVIIIWTQTRSLNKIVFIKSAGATTIIQILILLYLLAIASLFFFALAIL